MDPGLISPEQWELIQEVLIASALVLGLTLSGLLAFLLAHAVLPSLIAAGEVTRDVWVFRPILYLIAALALSLAVVALGWGLLRATDVLWDIYPRFWI